jgi:hypothetical protein
MARSLMRWSPTTPSSSMVPPLEGVAQPGDAQVVAVFAPELQHHRRDRLVLDLFEGMLHRAHLGDARHQHVDVFIDVDDVGEGIEADVHVGAELDIGALRLAAQLLETAAEVEHPDLGADGAVGPGHLVHQHRLARARRADDGEVVVAQVVVEDVQRHQLPAPAAEDQGGGARAAPLGDQRRHVDGVGHGLARHPAHLDQVPVELLGQRHGEARQQRLAVHVGVGVQLEAAAAPDGVGRFVGGDRLVRGGEQRQLVIQAHQAAAGVDGIRRRRPVLELLIHVRHHVGHLRLGVLGGPHMVGGDHRLGDVGVEHLHAQGEQKGCAVLQGRLHQVADEGAHLPQREAFRKTLDREEACLQDLGAGFLPQGEAAGMRVLDGVEVHDLVAQLAAIVVVQVRRIGLGDAVGVGEEGAPVDQVGGIANAVGERGRAQRRGKRIAQRHQLVAFVEILGVSGKRDGEHQRKSRIV